MLKPMLFIFSGAVSLEYPLSLQPVYGKWTIQVIAQVCTATTFKIQFKTTLFKLRVVHQRLSMSIAIKIIIFIFSCYK